jgi:hypothetical protein
MNIISNILCGFNYSDNGTGINAKVKEIIASGTVRKDLDFQKNDTMMLQELASWVEGSFKDWAEAQLKPLAFPITPNSVCLDSYIAQLNTAIENFSVAGAYYAMVANKTISSSIEAREDLKSAICREFADALVLAYKNTIAALGDDSAIVQGIGSVESGRFYGSPIEHYQWNGTFVISYPKFNSTTINVGQDPAKKSYNLKVRKDHLPWVIAMGFGLIAWTASASKK